MASKLALLAFVAFLLVAHAGARLQEGGQASGAARAFLGNTAVVTPPPSREGHILWNAGCWLLGVGLLVTFGRRSELQPARPAQRAL